MIRRTAGRRQVPSGFVPGVLALVSSFLLLHDASAMAATLVIEVTGVDNGLGLVRAAVCPKELFTTRHCPWSGATAAQRGTVTLVIEDVPPGRYAVQAFHDEDASGRVRRGLFGLPREAIGFSRDALLRLGPPRFEDAAIDVAEPSTTTQLRLRHVGP